LDYLARDAAKTGTRFDRVHFSLGLEFENTSPDRPDIIELSWILLVFTKKGIIWLLPLEK